MQPTSIVKNYFNNTSGNSRNNTNDEHGKGIEKYGRISLQRNLENSYRNMYESKINSSHEYYSKTESTYSTSYLGNKLSTNAFSLPVHQNSEIYNAYHSHTDGINSRSFEHLNNNNYLGTEGNPPKQYQGMRLDRELPIYHFSSSREQVPADTRPLVIDTHTHVTISDRKYVSDTRMVVSDPYDSGTNSPTGTASNYSVVGTHGSESNYDVEEDLDVILTSTEEQANQEQSSDDQVQNWITQNSGAVKNELGLNDVISCKYSSHSPNDTGTSAPSGPMTTRDDQYWHQYHAYNYGNGCGTYPEQYPSADGFQNHHDQAVGYQDSTPPPPQYHSDSSPAPQGLGSHMYNSLLMAYNCSNYQDNSPPIDYHHGRYNTMMPLTHSSGPVCV